METLFSFKGFKGREREDPLKSTHTHTNFDFDLFDVISVDATASYFFRRHKICVCFCMRKRVRERQSTEPDDMNHFHPLVPLLCVSFVCVRESMYLHILAVKYVENVYTYSMAHTKKRKREREMRSGKRKCV
jgi:hypothetical protein